MIPSISLLGARRFLPLFVTQFLGAFNDNLFKNALIFFVTYSVYNDVGAETTFSAVATGIFILPFFLFSALAGELADSHDKAAIMRTIKWAEIGIMIVGATGIFLELTWVMLLALFAMGVHSTFFGPIKYAVLPQHLAKHEVLGGTGLVEAGTYVAILAGTIAGGLLHPHHAAIAVIGVAVIGMLAARSIPPAPPSVAIKIDWNVLRSSIRLVRATMHVRRLFLAIVAISVFWSIAAMIAVLFPPLVKNVYFAEPSVASSFLAVFSIGIAIGSVIINRLLKGEVSARYAPASVLAMGGFLIDFWFTSRGWSPVVPGLADLPTFLRDPGAIRVFFDLAGISITGGMFVVPLYAFLTTIVDQSQTARTVAANNIVNSGAMVIGSVGILGVTNLGIELVNALWVLVATATVSAYAAWRLHQACD
ncbi:MFS transporter [Sphingomonas qomolangmaensis]|uniref:MFS transporter n=1 Tax=Sphingomonas qomolangmaensis TaxID=2918765 RepID=A0ABY5LAY0_9SPHN|nr:MFS transporter [Sphingomonas qomolangmaensis]UUL83922.1 MFS transporter [Sphingomonas qomolangmaensis]